MKGQKGRNVRIETVRNELKNGERKGEGRRDEMK